MGVYGNSFADIKSRFQIAEKGANNNILKVTSVKVIFIHFISLYINIVLKSCTYTSKFACFVLIHNYAVVDYSVTGILYQYNYNE